MLRESSHDRDLVRLGGAPVYMLSGAGKHSDWVRDLIAEPGESFRIGGFVMPGRARLLEDTNEDALARRLVFAKYQPGYGEDLSDWRRSALPVAIDLDLAG